MEEILVLLKNGVSVQNVVILYAAWQLIPAVKKLIITLTQSTQSLGGKDDN